MIMASKLTDKVSSTSASNQSAGQPIPASDGPQKPWKVLIYLAADNNLKEESVYTLTEILEAEVGEGLDVFAQFDSGDAIRLFDFKNQPQVRPGRDRFVGFGQSLFSNPKLIQRLSDSELLEEFLEQRLDKGCFNLVVLSGHGSGAVGDFLTSNNPPSTLSIPDIRSVLSSARQSLERPIDVLGMDSCLMSMAEVGYELRDDVKFLVGAEGFARNAGWPYRQILTALQNDLAMKPETLARLIVQEYIHFYAPYTMCGVSVDQAACDLAQMEELKNAMETLAVTLRDKLRAGDRKVENAVLLAHWRAQSYKLDQYVDLWDFCGLLVQDCEDPNVRTACVGVQTAVRNVVLLSCYTGAAFQYSQGLSIYFPWAKPDLDRNLPFYKNLSFARDTHWDEFLAVYGERTQRPPNQDRCHKDGEPNQLPMSVETEIGVGFAEGVRTNRLEGTKTNRLEGTKGGAFLFPMVKNPPNEFLKYENDCADAFMTAVEESAM